MKFQKFMIGFILIPTVCIVGCSGNSISNDKNSHESDSKTEFISVTPSPEADITTEEKAISISKSLLTDNEINTITNYDSPQITNVKFDKEPRIAKFDDKSIMINKDIYKITYTTSLDGLLGPIVIYIDVSNGVIYGEDFRM